MAPPKPPPVPAPLRWNPAGGLHLLRVGLLLSSLMGLAVGSFAGAAHAQVTEPDSASRVAEAHAAQARYERDRVRHLPRNRTSFSAACEETVGRMCLRLQETSDWWPAPDPPGLLAARERLIEALAAAWAVAPGDDWILGQWVIYLGEAGRWDEAGSAARRCGEATRWWCAALHGLALHRQGHYLEAEGRFREALAAMPPELREEWLDVEPLLSSDGTEARQRRLEEDRVASDSLALAGDDGPAPGVEGDPHGADALWWRLADPLFLVPGNDRLTDHFARHTVARTREGARNPYATSWGWDLAEVMVRYGVEVGWARELPPPGSIGAATTAVGHHHPRSRGFLPPPGLWTDPAATPSAAWNPGDRERPASVYAPEYAPIFLPAPVQISTSRRGDGFVVRAGWGLPDDTTWHTRHDHPPLPTPPALPDTGVVRGLFVVPVGRGTVRSGDGAATGDGIPGRLDAGGTLGREGAGTIRRRVATDTAGGALSVEVPPGEWVVSVEIWDRARGLAGRHRQGLNLPVTPVDVPAVSDLLVTRAEGAVPVNVDDFLRQVGAPPRLRPGDAVRVGWEVTGLGWQGAEPLGYRLELRAGDGNLLTRVGRWLGVVGDPAGVEVRWQETGPPQPAPAFRAMDLTLPATLDEGSYTLRLTLVTEGRAAIVTERPLELRWPG